MKALIQIATLSIVSASAANAGGVIETRNKTVSVVGRRQEGLKKLELS